MRMILQYEDGRRASALILARSRDRMRVVFQDARDTTELRLLENQWMSENGDAVDIEALLVEDGGPAPSWVVQGHAA
jgi:hypothetical protein